MGMPCDGVETTYRNSIHEVAFFLDFSHPGHYLVFNLTERTYNINPFHYQVQIAGWADHTAPPLTVLWELCLRIDHWLSEDSDHTAVVHCLAGKGRTGTLIASYLVFSRQICDWKMALDFFASRRSLSRWGVQVPSQRLYVSYIQQICDNGEVPGSKHPILLRRIKVTGLKAPQDDCVDLNIYNVSSRFESDHRKIFQSRLTIDVACEYDSIVLHGDIFIDFCFSNGKQWASHQFHTSMIDCSRPLFLAKADLDKAYKDSKLNFPSFHCVFRPFFLSFF